MVVGNYWYTAITADLRGLYVQFGARTLYNTYNTNINIIVDVIGELKA